MKKPLVVLWLSIVLAHLPVAFGYGLAVNSLFFWWVFPLFAMYVARGYFLTSCLASYMVRLGICALVSQPFWVAYFGRLWFLPNPIAMLLGALVVFWLVDPDGKPLGRPKIGKLWRWEFALYPAHLAALLALKVLLGNHA